MSDLLYGRNAIRESLRARRRHFHRLLLAEGVETSGVIAEILSLAGDLNVPVKRISRKKLDSMTGENQGVVLETGRYPMFQVDEILHRAEKQDEPPFILALDHIDNPHNLGAIIRTAEIVGVHGLLIPKNRAVEVTPAVVKASAGAAEHMWVAQITNLTREIKQLKEQNIWVAGVEFAPEATLYTEANLAGAMALVIGSEGDGMSRLVKETCDFLIKLPMRGEIESLNASVAAGIMLYEVWRARGFG